MSAPTEVGGGTDTLTHEMRPRADEHRIGTPLSGRDLRAERVRRGLRAEDVAQLMGVSRSRVSLIEALLAVPSRSVDRYVSALASVDDGAGRGAYGRTPRG